MLQARLVWLKSEALAQAENTVPLGIQVGIGRFARVRHRRFRAAESDLAALQAHDIHAVPLVRDELRAQVHKR